MVLTVCAAVGTALSDHIQMMVTHRTPTRLMVFPLRSRERSQQVLPVSDVSVRVSNFGCLSQPGPSVDAAEQEQDAGAGALP